jgi:hypothetical protein
MRLAGESNSNVPRKKLRVSFINMPRLKPTRRICSREAKNKSWQCDWSAKKFAAKKLDQSVPIHFYCLREQMRLVENGLNEGPKSFDLFRICKGK